MQLEPAVHSHYIPPPILDPNRVGYGLYSNLTNNHDNNIETAPVMATKARINVGKEFQCTSLPRCKKMKQSKIGSSSRHLIKEEDCDVLCWTTSLDSDKVTNLLAWNQSASVPGPKRTPEEILIVLTNFQGDTEVISLNE